MSRVNHIAMIVVLSLCYIFLSVTYGEESLPELKVVSRLPLVLSVSENGETYNLSPPSGFMREIEGAYNNVYVEDLNGDGVGEVVFSLDGGGVNSCSRVLHYNDSDRSLGELFFNRGGLCNFKLRQGYIVSSYKDGATWKEDVYSVKDGKASIEISDSCVGCGEVKRKEYHADGSFVRLLVSDNVDFKRRVPLTAKVVPTRAWIFSSPQVAQPTKKYLIRGDKVMLLGIDTSHGEDWIEFRFTGKTTTEGWLKSKDLEGWNEL